VGSRGECGATRHSASLSPQNWLCAVPCDRHKRVTAAMVQHRWNLPLQQLPFPQQLGHRVRAHWAGGSFEGFWVVVEGQRLRLCAGRGMGGQLLNRC
jgi:hypothetical protein